MDFNFSREFNKAIEDKQVAEQRALRAIQKWDGIMPTVTAGDASLPVLGLNGPMR